MGMTLDTICDGLDDIRKLVLQQDCFSVIFRDATITELCCLKKMATPVDGYRRMSELIPGTIGSPGTATPFVVFDNKFDTPNPVTMQTRGIILYVNYPKLDYSGAVPADYLCNIKLRFTNSIGESYTLPVYDFFSLINNPVITEFDDPNYEYLLNRVEIINDHDFDVSVEVLTVLVHKDGVSSNGRGTSAC